MTAAYTDVTAVRLLTNLTTSDISDADVTSLIAEATKQVNMDINIQVIREWVLYIDRVRKNIIDGTNATFYVQNWEGKFLADFNNDGDVTTSDLIVYDVSPTSVESQLTISSVVPSLGKFVLSAAPTPGHRLYVTYAWARVCEASADSLSYPFDPRVKLATTLLTAAYCYMKINTGRAPMQTWGSVKIQRHMDAYNDFKKRYDDIIYQIHSIQEVFEQKSGTTV